jgi:MFS transporter, DHA1 family, tetracycline resistance protein
MASGGSLIGLVISSGLISRCRNVAIADVIGVRADRRRAPARRPVSGNVPTAPPRRLHRRTKVARSGISYRSSRLATSMARVHTLVLARRTPLPVDVRVLAGAGFVVAVGYGIVTPALPEFARSFDVGVTAASAIVSAFALCRVVFAPMSGRLVLRLGELTVLRIGLAVVALSSAACAVASGYGELLAYRAAGGIGSTMFSVSSASLLIKRSPPAMRGRAAAAWATGWLLGGIAGPVLGGVLMAMSMKAPFLIYAALLVLVAVSVGGALPAGETSSVDPEADNSSPLRFRDALHIPTFRACVSSNFLDGWIVYGIRIALVPLFIVDVLGGTSTWSGVALTVFAAGAAATLMVGGSLADRWGRKQSVLFGSLVVVVAMASLGLSGSPAQAAVWCALSGAGMGLLTPPVDAAVADVVTAGGEGGGGRALAGFQMVGDLGAIVGPVLAGLTVELAGYPFAFGLTALIAAASLLCWQQASEVIDR